MQTWPNTQLSDTDFHIANLALYVLCGPPQFPIMTILLLHPLLLPTPQCRCGVLCLACVHFLPYVLLFLILCFLLLDICGWLLYLPISFLFFLQSPPLLRQYHCASLTGGLQLDVQNKLDLDSQEIHLPPPDLRCAPPCVLTNLQTFRTPLPCLPNMYEVLGFIRAWQAVSSLGYIPGLFFIHSSTFVVLATEQPRALSIAEQTLHLELHLQCL